MAFESKMENSGSEEAKTKFEMAEFHFEAIAALEAPIEKMLEELRENINAGVYKVVLGDDASGRIPALVFGEALSNIYKTRDLKPLQVRFLAANPTIPKPDLEDRIVKVKSESSLKSKDKVLIVTDTISHGWHLLPIVQAFRQQNIAFDVASVGIFGGKETAERFEKDWECKIVYGNLNSVPSIYFKHDLGGVVKEHGDLISRQYKKATEYRADNEKRLLKKINKKEIQKTINFAREDVKNLSARLSNTYLAESEYKTK